MNIDQTKRRAHRRHSDTSFTFPAATTSIIRRVHRRADNDLHGPTPWQFARHLLRGLFPRIESSGQIGLHASTCMSTRPA
ncbi:MULTISPECIES: hypothetical protein [Paraburkholderia]|uniref:Uncharacterized protein n=1 Tax=Paraburkholderia madseniana TaxID=2599607 RepID=A0AAP5BDQ8_9BURK|nr:MULTISPECIES: hypothetical protein [Paraburkholderia]MCX4146829.1 hypothetical protein [Paraburkholderia madseniana]MDN7149775.1 hypothetical protein [Paraburkholderia sp. WS6]MDQ6408655.1 hypothetical protein [Paraburkholderia madseniana]